MLSISLTNCLLSAAAAPNTLPFLVSEKLSEKVKYYNVQSIVRGSKMVQEIKNTKVWFNKLEIACDIDIEYTNNGRPTKPYLSSFIIRLSARYGDRIYDEIAIKVFQPSDKILVEYNDKDIDLDSKSPTEFNYVYAKSPIEYTGIPNFSSIGNAFDHMDIPDYIKRVLRVIVGYLSAIKIVQDEIQDLSNTPDDLPRVTQTLKYRMILFDENPESLGKVYIDEYFTINDETEYEVSHNTFKVEQLLQSDHGELIAITDRQEIEAIIPTQKEFENLVQFVRKLITAAQRIA